MIESNFRVWDKEQNIMKSGFDLLEMDIYISPANGNLIQISDPSLYLMDRFILMKNTGIPDKNGKEIFENDIVCQVYGENLIHENTTGIVMFGEFGAEIYSCFGWYVGIENKQVSEAGLDADSDFLILGNVFENKNLLENN